MPAGRGLEICVEWQVEDGKVAKNDDMNWDHREIRTFAYLHSAADWAVEQAEAVSDRQMFPSMHAILASVHCLEAFTNHLGPRYFGDRWDTKEANLATPKDKLKALLAHCRINLEDVQSAYDSYMLGLGIQKELTHGRTHEISKGNAFQFVEESPNVDEFPNRTSAIASVRRTTVPHGSFFY